MFWNVNEKWLEAKSGQNNLLNSLNNILFKVFLFSAVYTVQAERGWQTTIQD